MPVVLTKVVRLLREEAEDAVFEPGDRCAGCGCTQPGAAVTVRNRSGPPAVRQVRLCPDCLTALEVTINLDEE